MDSVQCVCEILTKKEEIMNLRRNGGDGRNWRWREGGVEMINTISCMNFSKK